jgi:hypothetical protein
MNAVVAEIGDELSRQGKRVLGAEVATTRFEQHSSSEPENLSDSELQKWLASSRAGIRYLALGEHGAAFEQLREAQDTSERSIVFLNRTPKHAQLVLDTCLYMVRTLLEIDRENEARAEAERCAFLSPAVEPKELMHPPAPLALLERARQEGARRTGSLLVDGNRTGCDVRINGAHLGKTPWETAKLVLGTHAVQVECDTGHRGRVHSVRLGTETTRLRIDSDIDRTVRTRPTLRVEYRNPSGPQMRKAAARGIARALPARWVLLVTRLDAETIELDVVGSTESRMRCARIDVGPKGVRSDALTVAIRNVIDGKCRSITASTTPAGSPAPPRLLFKPGI